MWQMFYSAYDTMCLCSLVVWVYKFNHSGSCWYSLSLIWKAWPQRSQTRMFLTSFIPLIRWNQCLRLESLRLWYRGSWSIFAIPLSSRYSRPMSRPGIRGYLVGVKIAFTQDIPSSTTDASSFDRDATVITTMKTGCELIVKVWYVYRWINKCFVSRVHIEGNVVLQGQNR